MPDATITSTASTFGSISGTFAADQSTISGTVLGPVAGTLSGSVGVPGPAGPAGEGLPAGGTEGQIIVKASDTDYDTVWVDNSAETLTSTVRNETGATLAAGTVVYINGAAGNKATVAKASASAEATSSKTFAILSEAIPNNQNGTAVTVGLLKGLDTSGLTEGGSLWLSTTAGAWTQTMPTAPNHAVFLGTVTRVHANQGTVEVRIQNGYELQELHNVKITSVSDGQVLKYDSAQSLWVNGTDVGGVAWGSITGTLSSQADLQSALDSKLPKAGGYITGDIQSSNNSAYRSWDGTYNTAVLRSDYLQLTNGGPGGNALTVEWNGITFASGKQTVHYPGTSILSGYATESWVTAGFYPLSGNPSGFLTSAALTPYLTSATAASTYQTIAGMSSYLTTSDAASTYAPLASPTFTGTVTIPAGASISGYATTASLASYAPLASPAFTGNVTITTNSASPAMIITQDGAGDIIQFKDVTSDTTYSFIDANGKVNTPAATTAGAGFNIGTGVTPTSPSNGDIWLTTTNLTLRVNGVTHTIPSLGTNNTFTGTASFSSTSVNVGTSTATAGYSLGNGATISGATKTIQIGTGGVAGSTTNISIGSTTGTSTTTLQGSTVGTTLAADTNTTGLATTAFVVGQASATSPVMDGTATVGTSLKYARADHVHPTDTTRAALASPTFTGTPAAPTAAVDTNTTQLATTAYVVGQGYLKSATASSTYAPLASPALTGTPTAPTATAGTNTTQIATTAFVLANAGATYATSTQSRAGTSTTVAQNPSTSLWQAMNPGMIDISRMDLTYTATGTMGTAGQGFLTGRMTMGTAGAAGANFRTFGSSQIDQAWALMSKTYRSYIDFSKFTWCSGRFYMENAPVDPLVTAAFYYGKANNSANGDLARAGFGWKLTGNATASLRNPVLQVHNGTTLTNVTSTFAAVAQVYWDWDIISLGNGTVTLYINGTQVATTNAGPTADTSYSGTSPVIWNEEFFSTGTTLGYDAAFGRGRIYVAP